MAVPARRSLERIALLARGFALLIGAIAGGQSYASGGSASAAAGIGFGAFAAVYVVVSLILGRYRRYLQAADFEPERPLPPRRPVRKKGRRVMTDRGRRE